MTAHPYTSRPSLAALMERTRAAVVSRAAAETAPPQAAGGALAAAAVQRPQPAPQAPSRPSWRRTATPEPVTARPAAAADPPPPRVLASFPSADELTASLGVTLSRGAQRVWRTLYRLAVDVARAREYTVTPSQVTYHCPAISAAAACGYTDRHLRSLVSEVERAGLLDAGGHAQNVCGRSLYDGTLWSVRTQLDADAPRIRADEWRHNWRPDFAADVEGRKGAAAEISELQATQADAETKYQAAKARAAVLDSNFSPAVSSSEIPAPAGLRAVAERLSGLWHIHPRHRSREVGQLASALCAALCEPERRRYWCRALWEALKAQNEGRTGGLQALAAQLSRLAADLSEGAPWHRPGAVLAARLKAA